MKGGVCIGKNIKGSTEHKLYRNYSIEKAQSTKTSFKEHKKVSLDNGLSKTEAFVNAFASKLVSSKSGKFNNAAFNAIKRFSLTWDKTNISIEKNKHRNSIIRRYLDRCDSLVKKLAFILSLLKGPAKVLSVIAVVIFSAAQVVNAMSYDVVLGAYADGHLVGYLNSKSPMSLAQNALESDLSNLTGSAYNLDCEIDYSFINVKDPVFMSESDCYRALYDIASAELVDAYVLYIDGASVACTQSFDSLNSLLKKVSIGSSQTIKNDISIVNQPCLKSSIKSIDEIAQMLNLSGVTAIDENAPEMMTNRLEAEKNNNDGEVLSSLDAGIPRFSGGVDKTIIPGKLSDGTKITTNKDTLLHELDLVYIREELSVENLPYSTTYEESDDYYVGTQFLKTAGRDGQIEVIYEIEYNSDGVISKTEISRVITKQPITEVMVIGTSEAPTTNASGNFIWPCPRPYGITSEYGARTLFGSYDFHLGIDMPNNYGTDILAADSGTVTYAGYNGSYGYYVIIDHGSGLSTLYAHMSKIYTHKDAAVTQGDVIGAVGSTGVSTANHLHFEVSVDGKTVDPLDFLPEE